MDDVFSLPNAVFAVSLFLSGIAIRRVFQKHDEADKKQDRLSENHAVLDAKHTALLERVVGCEHGHKNLNTTISGNFEITRQSIHKAADRAAEIYARRDDMAELKKLVLETPEKVEGRVRAILADRDAHRK